MKILVRISLVLVLFACTVNRGSAHPEFLTVDRFVPHTSTVDANAGELVGIFLREKLSSITADSIDDGQTPSEVVLFVHGGSVPSVPDYDLPFKDYSWMEYLARAGFDTFAMDQTGYGLSPRPTMENACNLDTEQRSKVSSHALAGASCEPSYSSTLTSLQSDWDEIDTVVDYIRDLRGVDRVHLIGWSAGGRRAGGYASLHPSKVENVVLYAPGYSRGAPQFTPDQSASVPMLLQTRPVLMEERWEASIGCDNQVDPGIQNVIWRTIMAFDPLGAVWGPDGGVMRVRTSSRAGFDQGAVSRITAPTLILVGKQDGLLGAGRDIYADLSNADRRVLVEMDCSTHFAVWETTQYKFLHEASREWLMHGEFRGQREGVLSVGINGAPKSH